MSIDVTSGLSRVTDSPDNEPVLWTDINGVKHTTPPGTMRTFGFNSPEAHQVLCAREPDPYGWGPRVPNIPLPPRPTVMMDEDYRPEGRG